MLLTIDEVGDLLDEIAETIPEALFRGLNGGVILQEDALPDPQPGAEDLYILGEYCTDYLGRYVNLYYGSFAKLFFDAPLRVWKRELRTTLLHELTHHIESLAGVRDLEVKDELEMELFRAGENPGWEDEDFDDWDPLPEEEDEGSDEEEKSE